MPRIPDLPEDLVADPADLSITFDAATGKTKRITIANFFAALAKAADLAAHIANVTNPHSVTKAQVGLGNVDNTSDAAKPLSTAATSANSSESSARIAGDAASVQRANHTGTQSADTITDGTTNKAYTATEKTKLAGIASGATANSSDATLLNRTNHTGTQSADTLTDGTTNKAFLATERTKLAAISGTNTGDQTLNGLLPSQTGNSGKYLTTDGSNASWGVVAGGAGSGIVRNVSTITSSVTVGATAGVDYVVLVGASGAPTLPTAVGNTNLYTIKNIHSTNKTVATTSSQTIDGSTTITLTPNTSVDLISDGANWRVV